MKDSDLVVYDILYQKERKPYGTTQFQRPVKLFKPTALPPDWTWVQVTKKTSENSEADSVEIVSLYSADHSELKGENKCDKQLTGGLLGISSSKAPFPNMIERSFVRSITPPFQAELMHSSPMLEMVDSFILMDRISSIASIPMSEIDTIEGLQSPELISRPLADNNAENEEIVPLQLPEPDNEQENKKCDSIKENMQHDISSPNNSPETKILSDSDVIDTDNEDVIKYYLTQYENLLDTFIDLELWLYPFGKKYGQSPKTLRWLSYIFLAGIGSYLLFKAR